MAVFHCSSCGSAMQVEDHLIPPSGVVVKCPTCSAPNTLYPPENEELDLDSVLGADQEQQPPPNPHAGTAMGGWGNEPQTPVWEDGSTQDFQSRPSSFDLPTPSVGVNLEQFDEGLDLPAPRGSTQEPDLLAPVHHAATHQGGYGRGRPGAAAAFDPADLDLPGPVEDSSVDLPAPVQTHGAWEELSDVQLPAPGDLPRPVGPHASRDMQLAPANLPTPVTPAPYGQAGPAHRSTVMGMNAAYPPPSAPPPMPPMGGPPPRPAGPAATYMGVGHPGSAAPPPPLDLDDLEVSPATAAGQPGAFSLDDLDLPPPDMSGGAGGVGNFDLGQPQGYDDQGGYAQEQGGGYDDQAGYGEPTPAPMDSLQFDDSVPAGGGGFNFDPPPANTIDGPGGEGANPFSLDNLDLTGSSGGLDSLEAPDRPPPGYAPQDSNDAFSAPSDAGPLDIDGELPQGKGKLDDEVITDDAAELKRAKKKKPKKSAEEIRRQRIIAAVIAGVLVVGGGGFTAFSYYSSKKAREAKIAEGKASIRGLLAADAPGHWDKAVEEGNKVLELDDANTDALGMQAQAHLGAAIDDGRDEQKRIDLADAILNKALRVGGQGAEVAKAQAMRTLLDGKPTEALAALNALAAQDSNDPNLPLYQGWAALEADEPEAALNAFTRAESMSAGRLPAVFGKARALLESGGANRDKAKDEFAKVLEKRSGHLGARVGLVELMPHDREGTREKRLEEIIKSEEAQSGNQRMLARSWVLYGDEALASGRVEAAYERYTTALKLDQRNLAAQVGIGLTALEQRKLPEAKFRLEGVLASDKDNVRAHVALTRLSLLEGKVSEARHYIQKAMETKSQDPDVQMWLGNVLVAEGADTVGAETAFRKAIELDKNNYPAYVALSTLLRNQGRTDEALTILEPVEQAAQTDPFLATSLGLAYLDSNEPHRAQSWFEKALVADADNVDARANLGSSLENQGKLDEALVAYGEAYKRTGKTREDIALRYAAALEKAKMVKESRQIYTELLAPRTDGTTPSLAGRAAAGRFYARQMEFERAVALGLAILTDDPRNPAGLFLRGVGEELEGDLVAASRSMGDAVALDPQPQYYNGLGGVYEKQNAIEDALNAYEQAIKRDPSYVKPRLGRARIRILRREYSAALPELMEAAKLQPDNAEVQFLIGECLFELGATSGERRKATEYYERAATLDPTRADAYFKLGQIHFDDDRASEAISAFQRYLNAAPRTDPRRAEAFYYLGYAYRAKRDKGAACRAYREYIDVAMRGDHKRGDVERELLSCP